MSSQQVLEVDCHNHSGIFLSNDGLWNHQIIFLLERALCRVKIMRKLKFKLDHLYSVSQTGA